MKNRKFSVKSLADRKGEVRIYDEIGPSFWGDSVDAKSFADEIENLDVEELHLRVNSPGGDVFDGITIMNALKRHPAKVIAYVDGLAASAASVIIAGGADEVVMCEGSQQMIHDAWSWGAGSAEDMAKLAADLDRTSDSLAKIYARRAGTPAEEWRKAMQDESWFTAEEAVAVGLAHRLDTDDVDETADEAISAFSRGLVMATFKHRGRAAAPTPAIATKARKEPDMGLTKELARMLGMTDDNPTDDQIKAALKEVLEEQDEKTPEGTTPPAEKSVEEAEADLAAARAAEAGDQEKNEDGDDSEETTPPASEDDGTVLIDKAVYEDLLERAGRGDKAAEEDKHERAATLIENEGIKAGRLLGWQRDAWVEKATEDFAATKASLLKLASGSIPLQPKGRGGSDEHREKHKDPVAAKQETHALLDAHEIFTDKY
ncbi:Clp protease ClpP [Corynebacterium sp. YIM 101645]|uniref:ATP-dependent Clp protease proteolytic subunit n=1 Tax=Corynebacterium lemuris TaxID=1859292 RepID=A0ABT2G0K5_9CORY|nr:head maturation protease, ClpP-related [Corynebacterium lemuris]MCS5479827.1 Clp protease ClpP [Corynebacterium lemuris]